MDFNSYLLKKIALNGATSGSFGSLTSGATSQLQNVSLFTSASLEQLKNVDLEELLKSENATDGLDENATTDEKALNEIIKALMELEEVQQAADVDGNGLDTKEAMNFLKEIMGNDGDAATLTLQDIDKAIEKLGIDLEAAADKAILEALSPETLEELEKAKEAENSAPVQSSSGVSSAGGGSGVSGAGNTTAAKNTKSLEDTIAEIEAKIDEKNAEIDEIEANTEKQIQEQEEAKEKAMKDAGVSDKEYEEYQKQEQEIEEKIKGKDDEISKHKDTISQNEATISSNENYIDTIDAQISANESAMNGIKDDTDGASSKKADLQGKIDNLKAEKQSKEEENNKLKEKNAEEEKSITKAETEKQQLETQKQELLSKTLDNSKDFGKGINSSSDVSKVKEEIGKFDTKIAELRATKDEKIQSLRADIQDLNVKLQDAKEQEKRNEFLRDNSPNDGQSIVDLAMTFEGKSQSEMREIMRSAGYQFDDGAWCADFVSFIAGNTIGEDNLPDWYKNCNRAYCPDIYANAKANGATVSVSEAQAGDAILFDWNDDGTADHIGYVVSVNADGTVNTIEGNTTSNSKVAAQVRNPGSIMTCVKLT